MAKKTPKTLNKRTRRMIRRTVGCICLVMAILVAAIPTEKVAAIGGKDTDTTAPEPTYTVSDYSSSSWDFLKESSFSTKPKFKGYTIRELSTGSYYLDWAYEFYKSTTGNVITQFNTGYSTIDSALTVDVEVVTQYPSITIPEYNQYITDNIDTALSLADIEKFYPSVYDKFMKDYAADDTTPLPEYYVSDLTEDQRKEYYCEHTYYPGTSNTYKGCTLMPVYDISNTDDLSNAVYIPYNKSTGKFYETDDTKAMVNYIGEGAFKNVTNIATLVIPSDVVAIGDEAFEGVTGIKSLTLSAKYIGNRAFYGCTGLSTLSFAGITERLGTESFANCNTLASVIINDKMEVIGEGAFAYCRNLKNLDMSATTTNFIIEDYAFFDCYALNDVKFAPNTEEIHEGAFAVQSSATGLWKNIVFPEGITVYGDYILSGRANAEKVVISASYGSSSTATIQSGFFRGCVNLQTVEFPDTGTGSCQSLEFPTNAFYDVLTENFYLIGPGFKQNRDVASPRECARKAGITYRFLGSDGKEYYEASTGAYMYLVSEGGILEDCTLIDESAFDGTIEVPSYVGELQITQIGATCFDDEKIKSKLKKLVIEDDSVKIISNAAFKDYTSLEEVYIGNTVTDIGDSAFEGCNALKNVYFSTPKGGYASLRIGNNAFLTGGTSLIFHGDINTSYAPFTWAMADDNYMDATLKIRVCYMSNEPYSLMVMKDEETGLVTLLDYPHYETLPENVRLAYEDIYVNQNDMSPYVMTAAQLAQVEATMHIDIPAGVQSIDVKGFIAGNGNRNNVNTYLQNNPYYKTYKQYGLFNGFYGNGAGGTIGADANVGREYLTGSEYELVDQGNDRILSVKMSDVKRLPDQAFYSCENLKELQFGNALEDIGTAPVGGCDNLSSISGNSKFVCENGIIYSTNPDGSLNIEQVLSGRGDIVGEKYVTADTDPKLASVSSITDGAFRYCSKIVGVDLSKATKLKTIPAYCFESCTSLRTATLPTNLEEIKEYAFTNTTDAVTCTISGVETQIDNYSFERGNAVIRTFKNTAAATYAIAFNQQLEYINDVFTVHFIDYDGTELCPVQYIEDGGNATPPMSPSRKGYTFSGWSGEYISVTEDRILVAQYTKDDTDNIGNGNNNNQNQNQNQNQQPVEKTYKLTVENGTGTGSYKQGTTVTIVANAPATGKVFSKWTSTTSGLTFGNQSSATTTIVMPASDATVTATYVNASTTDTGNNNNNNNNNNGGSGSGDKKPNGDVDVDIDNDDFSNEDKADGTVQNSSDNYVIKITYTEEARRAVEEALLDEFGTLNDISYCAMDISLYDSTGKKKIPDAEAEGLRIKITIPIPDDMIEYAGNNRMGAVAADGTLDKLKTKFTTIGKVKCVTFTATHFSPYVVYVDTKNLTSGVVDETPKTGDFIHPKWFLSIGLVCLAMFLFIKKEKNTKKNKVQTA